MATVGIRELKNRLSHYLRLVQAGETLQVTDRGEVVAELVPPYAARGDSPYPELERLAREGHIRLGCGNDPSAYSEAPFRFPEGTGEALLDQERAER